MSSQQLSKRLVATEDVSLYDSSMASNLHELTKTNEKKRVTKQRRHS